MNKHTFENIFVTSFWIVLCGASAVIFYIGASFLSDDSHRTTVDVLGPPHAVLQAQLITIAAALVIVVAATRLIFIAKRLWGDSNE